MNSVRTSLPPIRKQKCIYNEIMISCVCVNTVYKMLRKLRSDFRSTDKDVVVFKPGEVI